MHEGKQNGIILFTQRDYKDFQACCLAHHRVFGATKHCFHTPENEHTRLREREDKIEVFDAKLKWWISYYCYW